MLISFETLYHFREMNPALQTLGMDAWVNARDFSLTVCKGTHSIKLHPQFVVQRNGQTEYINEFRADVTRFIGWRPYLQKKWQLSDSKLAFKQYVSEQGLPTPRYATVAQPEFSNLLIKKDNSSFGRGIKGPFINHLDAPLDQSRGEYYEAYVPGKIVKLWFWHDQPVAAELAEMVGLLGNGNSTIEQLALDYAKMLGREMPDLSRLQEFLH